MIEFSCFAVYGKDATDPTCSATLGETQGRTLDGEAPSQEQMRDIVFHKGCFLQDTLH